MVDIKLILEAHVNEFFAKWKRQMKMAMLIASSLSYLEDNGHKLKEDEVANMLYEIISDKDFATFGDITKWRHSEIVAREYL